MKRMTAIVSIATVSIVMMNILFSTLASAGEREKVWESNGEHGGFGSVEFGVTEVNDETVTMFGGKGAWLINKTAYIGGGATGSTSGLEDDRLAYGGLLIGYIFNPNNRTHFNVDLLIGAGEIEEDASETTTDFAVVEPGLDLRINLTKLVVMSVGLSYRFVNGVDTGAYQDSDLEGPSARVNILIGTFD